MEVTVAIRIEHCEAETVRKGISLDRVKIGLAKYLFQVLLIYLSYAP